MLSIAMLLAGFYLVFTNGIPGTQWGLLRGMYSGTGPWLNTHPTFGFFSGICFLAAFFMGLFLEGHQILYAIVASIGIVLLFIALIANDPHR